MSKPKKWIVGTRDVDETAVNRIAGELGVQYLTALLLYNRGYKTPQEAKNFIHLESELFHDPFRMTDMKKACDRIIAALEGNEKIAVYGDYDVDGVTATSLMCLYLSNCGANVSYYIPNRIGEGYGVNSEAIEKLVSDGTSLIITVDTGITAGEEISYASSVGCDVIVTDHHECHGDLPEAVAVVNPKRPDCCYPFKELAGVGVAFKLVTALEYSMRVRNGQSTDGFLSVICRKYIDLVALGTIADVMPLYDENRLIVSMGLAVMQNSSRPGLKAIIDASEGGKHTPDRKITSSLIGYTLAPRINAAGRLRSASRAVRLFLTDSETEASEIAEELCEANRMRQAEENRIISQIEERISSDPEKFKAPVIVLDDDNWHHGVIGIAASRITEKYNRPSILVSFEDDIGKGSGRSIKGMNLVDALTACSDLLLKYGGHELAAGLSVTRENLPELRKRLCQYASEHLTEEDYVTTLDIDCEMYPEEADLTQADELNMLEPFGVSNPVPLFLMRNITVVDTAPIGQGKHTKLVLSGGSNFTAVYFGISPIRLGYSAGDNVDIVFNLNVNEFMGRRSAQLVLRDIRFASDSLKEAEALSEKYKTTVRDGGADAEDIPSRDDFVSTYLRLKRILTEGEGEICVNTLLKDLQSTPAQSGVITYIRLRLVLDILSETGVITVTVKDDLRPCLEIMNIKINSPETKVNLEKSWLYRKLMNPALTYMPE